MPGGGKFTAMSATHRPPDSIDRVREAQRFGRGILPEVSRTFAISIKALPGVLGDAVCTAYLLCRIADTIEDDNTTAPEQRAAWLDAFPLQVRALQGDPAHLRLVAHTDLVLVAFRALPPRTRDRVAHWVREMGRGMAKFVRTYPRGIRIQTLPEYREYCYYVAGTVGCMLTELWHEHVPAVGRREFDRLWSRCQTFGEALQTVNILKDIAHDAEHENSIYLPAHDLEAAGSGHATLLSPAHVEHNHRVVEGFIALARTDLDAALEYTLAIPRRAFRVRAFCVLPLLFAYATLRDLSRSRAMLTAGGQVKISRAEVKALMLAGLLAIGSNAALRRLVASVQARPFRLGLVGA